MKYIRVTYRAIFEQPEKNLNPMGAKLPGPVAVEIYESSISESMWSARRPGTSNQFTRIGVWPGMESMKAAVKKCFARQTGEWEAYYKNAPLDLSTVLIKTDGRVFLLEPEDYTHIPDLARPHTDEKRGYAICGLDFKHQAFVSLRVEIPPTCKPCLVHWDRLRGQYR